MLAILLGVLSLVLAGGLAIVLPILAWAKMARLERELRELRAQLHALEHRGLQGAPVQAPEPRSARRRRRPRRRWSRPRRAPAPEVTSTPEPTPSVTETAAGPAAVARRPIHAGHDPIALRRCRARVRRPRRSHRRTADVVGRHDRAGPRRGVLPEVRVRQRLDHRVDARRAGDRRGSRPGFRGRSVRTARLSRLRAGRRRWRAWRRCSSRSTPRSAITS